MLTLLANIGQLCSFKRDLCYPIATLLFNFGLFIVMPETTLNALKYFTRAALLRQVILGEEAMKCYETDS
jgi:hypothetical protein